LFLSFPSLPTVCFAPVMLTMTVDRSMSFSVSQVSSMGLSPRSLVMLSFNAISKRALLIMKSTNSSLGGLRFLSYLW